MYVYGTLLRLSFIVCIILPRCMLESEPNFTWDPNGYIIFCPCMGRFGNQAEHYLGALAFAKSLDRTLILPPWRTYTNIAFDEWFQFAPLTHYHRVVLASDFMKHLAPLYWPPGVRQGWCWKQQSDKDQTCAMKEGNPFGPFWDGLEVDFDSYISYTLSYDEYDIQEWKTRYPPYEYPVMAFKGAPARFPILPKHRHIQQYFVWSDKIQQQSKAFVDKHFPEEKYIGLHLRNGIDWQNACQHADGMSQYMASPQCIDESKGQKVTKNICFPSKDDVLRLVKNLVIKTKVKNIYIATDKSPMTEEFKLHLKNQKVRVFHNDPWYPQIDLAILGQADYFIGNCVSSFTAFVKRERDVSSKPTEFWGIS